MHSRATQAQGHRPSVRPLALPSSGHYVLFFYCRPHSESQQKLSEYTPSCSLPPPSAPSLYITYRQKYESNPPTSIKRHIHKKICNLQSSPHPNYKPPVQIIISTYSIVHLTVSVHNNLYLNNKAHIILNCTHSCLIK